MVMQDKWNVDYTDEFGAWWEDQSVDVQEKLYKVVSLLEIHGPTLGSPIRLTSRVRQLPCENFGPNVTDIPTECCMCLTRVVLPFCSSEAIRPAKRIGMKEWFRLPRRYTRTI